MGARAIVVGVAVVLIWLGGPRVAVAANGTHPRTPVVWPETACIELVDRSVDPVLRLDYDIPFPDTDVTADEVDQSRTHQFFAFCRQTSPQDPLPLWITSEDVDDAVRMSLIAERVDDESILESNTDWAGCWHRITEDADRRPITFEMANEDVPWDTTGIPAGVYVVYGYTYEPAASLWMPRVNNVVRVFDGGDPAGMGPAATVDAPEDEPCVGKTIELTGCVSALPGTTATAEYALTTGPGSERPDYQLTWVPFATQTVEGDTLTIPWTLPAEVGEETMVLRVRFVDPNGIEYVAYRPGAYVVLPGGCDVDDCDGGFIQDASCAGEGGSGDASSSTTAGGETSSGTASSVTATGPSATEDEEGGCACGRRPSNGTPALFGLVLLAFVRRRR